MVFTKRLREGVRKGKITCSVRIWTRPHVKVRARYAMEEGEIEIDSIEPIGFPGIKPRLARESGFLGIVDLLKIAKHGTGENIYLVRFHYVRFRSKRSGRALTCLKGSIWPPRQNMTSPHIITGSLAGARRLRGVSSLRLTFV